MSFTATITSKGQITLPRAARQAISSRTVEIEVRGATVILKAVRSVGGALASYAGTGPPAPIGDAREKAWDEAARGRGR